MNRIRRYFAKFSSPNLVDRYEVIGSLFQVPMMVFFGCLIVDKFSRVGFAKDPVGLISIFGFFGSALFMWCLFRLYFRKDRLNRLIMTGPFKYTRHPMYLGLLLMDIPYLFLPLYIDLPWYYYLLQAGFLFNLVVAGYWQERETLARFGGEAEQYYAHTPRIPFLI